MRNAIDRAVAMRALLFFPFVGNCHGSAPHILMVDAKAGA